MRSAQELTEGAWGLGRGLGEAYRRRTAAGIDDGRGRGGARSRGCGGAGLDPEGGEEVEEVGGAVGLVGEALGARWPRR